MHVFLSALDAGALWVCLQVDFSSTHAAAPSTAPRFLYGNQIHTELTSEKSCLSFHLAGLPDVQRRQFLLCVKNWQDQGAGRDFSQACHHCLSKKILGSCTSACAFCVRWSGAHFWLMLGHDCRQLVRWSCGQCLRASLSERATQVGRNLKRLSKQGQQWIQTRN